MSQYTALYVPPGTSTWSVVAPCGTHSVPFIDCAVRPTRTGTDTSAHVTCAASAVPGARQAPAASSTAVPIRRKRDQLTKNSLQLDFGEPPSSTDVWDRRRS